MSDALLANLGQQMTTINASYGASVGNVGAFQQALDKAGMGGNVSPTSESPTLKAMTLTLDKLNLAAKSLADRASAIEAKGSVMSPGEMVMMTVKCHEFMFHCQLTSNVANRTSDGIQQMFRQQS